MNSMRRLAAKKALVVTNADIPESADKNIYYLIWRVSNEPAKAD